MGTLFSTIMGPLSCLAVAAAVMQVISFGNEMIGLYRNIKKNGSPDDSLEGKSAQIATNSRLIQDSLAKTSSAPPTEEDTALQGASKRCLDCSKALVDEMNNIKWKPMKKGGARVERSTARQVWMAWRCRSKIEKLEMDLKGVQDVMNDTILVSSWYAGNTGYALVWAITKLTAARLSSKAATAKQQQGFDNLDEQIKQFISDQDENYRKISTKIIQETAGVKKEIAVQAAILGNQISDQAQAHIKREQRLLFLGSLQFPTMRQRKNRVPEAHYKTFHWVFDNNISGPWDSFTAWLKSEEKVY